MAHETLAVVKAAEAFLKRIETMTSEECSRGGERRERELLRHALLNLKRGGR